MQAIRMPRPRSTLPPDVLKTICLVAPIITGAFLLRQLAAAHGGVGTFFGWGIVAWFSQGLELAASMYPAARVAEFWQAWIVAVLASVVTTVCGVMGYQLVITILATPPTSPQIMYAFGITRQSTIQDWISYLVVGLVGGVTSGLFADGVVWIVRKARTP